MTPGFGEEGFCEVGTGGVWESNACRDLMAEARTPGETKRRRKGWFFFSFKFLIFLWLTSDSKIQACPHQKLACESHVVKPSNKLTPFSIGPIVPRILN